MSFTPFERVVNNVNSAVTVIDGCKQAIKARGANLTGKTAFDYPDEIRNLPAPQLNPVTLNRNNDTVTITNPSTNGGFVGKYQLYSGATMLRELTSTSFSLVSLGAGDYELHVVALGTYFLDSIISNKIKASVYTITRTLTNLTANNSTALIGNGQSYSVTLSPASGYYLPEDNAVTMGGVATNKYEYDSYTGVVTFAAVTGNIVIQAAALSTPKLRRSTLSLSGTNLTITPPRYAESTKVYVDGTLQTTYTGTSAQVFDLSTLTAYGMYSITVQSEASAYDDSDVVALAYNIGATIKIQGDTLNILNVISGVTSYGIYVDGTLIDTVQNSGSTIDLSTYANVVQDGKHFVELNAIGTGIAANRSNPVTWFKGTAPIYGVSGLYNSAPALTRTDDAVDLDFVINSSTGAVDSDFDNVFPWNEAEIVEDAAGKFLKMPDMYFRVGVDNESRITDVAVSAMPSGSGDWYEVPSFMYGCYLGYIESNKLRSKTGYTPAYNRTRAQFRTAAAANGDGYCQEDLYHATVMMFLWWIEFANKNSQAVMKGREYGTGTAGGSSRRNTGGTDGVETPSGFETVYGQMRWHGIEDWVGNMWRFRDGICMPDWGGDYYVTDDPTKFADTTANMVTLSYKAPTNKSWNNCISAYGWDADHPFMCMPCETVNNSSYNTYFCDQIYLNGSSYPVLYCGSVFYLSSANYGLSYCNSNNVGNNNNNLGARHLLRSTLHIYGVSSSAALAEKEANRTAFSKPKGFERCCSLKGEKQNA